MKNVMLTICVLTMMGITQAEAKKKKVQLVEISTTKGNMVLYLYDITPKHKANFLKLVKEEFYNGTFFHRVINKFMIQGGDPYSKDSSKWNMAGQGGPGYTLDAEIVDGLIHKKGVLAAARMGDNVNPTKASSGSQFYIVQGQILNDDALKMAVQRRKSIDPNFDYTDEEKKIYKELGGTPWLDNEYTIFGEVISGLEVIDAIASVKTQPGDRPETPIFMDMKVIEISAKKVEKTYGFRVPNFSEKK